MAAPLFRCRRAGSARTPRDDEQLPQPLHHSAVLPLDQAREALARVAARHTLGKIALQIG